MVVGRCADPQQHPPRCTPRLPQPDEIADEVIRINTEARPIALQLALLVPNSSPTLLGLINLLPHDASPRSEVVRGGRSGCCSADRVRGLLCRGASTSTTSTPRDALAMHRGPPARDADEAAQRTRHLPPPASESGEQYGRCANLLVDRVGRCAWARSRVGGACRSPGSRPSRRCSSGANRAGWSPRRSYTGTVGSSTTARSSGASAWPTSTSPH